MFYEKIDLYEVFALPRGKNKGGYLTVYCREQRGDLTKKLRPAILVIPGGGYEYCSDREQEPVALRFFAAGYTAFTLEYTVKTPYPVPLVEAAMAMAFIRENARKYSVGDHVAAVGFSAGGHLAGMLATMYREPPVLQALGARAKLVRPDAVILSYAVLSADRPTANEETFGNISGKDEELRVRLSIDKRVDKHSSPAFFWHTLTDTCVPVENTLKTASAYREAGVPFELHIFDAGRHGLSVATVETEGRDRDAKEIAHIGIWADLALAFLGRRGFEVVNA